MKRRGAPLRHPHPTPRAVSAASPRFSDVSMTSSRPSVGGSSGGFGLPTDKHRQAEAVSAINAFLSSRNSLLSLRTHPVSSGKEIVETLTFVLHEIDFPVTKLEDDLAFLLKALCCPFKVNKTALRAPNTPHNWPSFLAVIHWLVQKALYKDLLMEKLRSYSETNNMVVYARESYERFLQNDDKAVEELDQQLQGKLERQRDTLLENVGALERNVEDLAKRLEAMKKEPTEKERLEKEVEGLELDLKKMDEANRKVEPVIHAKEREIEEGSRALGAKMEEKRMIDEENMELKKRVEKQGISSRDADRMRRELLAVEREIGETEASRSSWEEKSWDVDIQLRSVFKKLEELAIECNQLMGRLKLRSSFHYALNSEGSTVAEVHGVDYKNMLKPEFKSLMEELKTSTMAKRDKLTAEQKQSSELSAKIEGEKNNIDMLLSQNVEVEAELSLLKKQIEEYVRRCEVEAKKTIEEVEAEARSLDSLESEAAEVLKANSWKLQETARLGEDEIQMEARKLFQVVDAVSKFKEHVKSNISIMKNKLLETVSETSKVSLPDNFATTSDASI